MEWTNDACLKLIDEYYKRNPLWDADSINYRNLPMRTDLWLEIANHFVCSVTEIRKKLGSLLASYRRERLKEYRVKSWKSKWFAYHSFKFLNPNKYSTDNNNADPLTSDHDDSDDEESDSNETFKLQQIEEVKIEGISRVETRKSKSPSPPQPAIKVRKLNNVPSSSKMSQKIDQSQRDFRDPCTLFADYVVSKMKGYNHHTQNIVQHKINNILFEADMGHYDKSCPKKSNVESSS